MQKRLFGSRLWWAIPFGIAVFLSAGGCRRTKPPAVDAPRLNDKVMLRDITFYSHALNRDTVYRVIMPRQIGMGQRLPVVYLLHGGGGSYRDWSNYSDVGRLAEHGLILVMPEGDESYYTNAASRPEDRYEDFITTDLISDVEDRFPVTLGRAHRAIIGVSMGGFGAVKNALKHPGLFAFVGGLSSALDVPSRPFSIKRYGQWRHHRSIFGPWQSEQQHNNDPFALARTADAGAAPYFFLTCGDKEGLLVANRQFAALLEQRHFRYEFHAVPGGHDWNQWNGQIGNCFDVLRQKLD